MDVIYIKVMEMTKWFNTNNYHYIVPKF
ncbi:hypothetical protein [Blattabacterium punctulatus]|nr:hypothetical protein [Blattabacterium punctulatus]